MFKQSSENSFDTIQVRTGKAKGVHAFAKSNSLKVNVIVRLEFEHAYPHVNSPWS